MTTAVKSCKVAGQSIDVEEDLSNNLKKTNIPESAKSEKKSNSLNKPSKSVTEGTVYPQVAKIKEKINKSQISYKWRCHICGSEFASIEEFENHKSTVHKCKPMFSKQAEESLSDMQKILQEKVYGCEYCKAFSKYEYSAKEHMKQNHNTVLHSNDECYSSDK